MKIENTEKYRSILELEINRQTNHSVDLLIVPDIKEWSHNRCSNAKGNPIAMAVIDTDSGGWGILLRTSIDAEKISSILNRISFNGRHNAQLELNTPELFLRHTILHELAHLINNWGQQKEDDCDTWAFNKLK